MDFSKFRQITTFVFDVDGVFTDNSILVTENGDLLRTMNTRDGQALKYAMEKGYNIAIITKGFSKGVRIRFEMLGVPHIYDSLKEKVSAFEAYKSMLNLHKEEILYMGDDLPDLPVYDLAGISVCPADAAIDNLSKAQYITAKKGGEGCVREIIEKVMRIQNKWLI
ncbi:MAG: HAD hydrolase family protein [Saprospiraceae bacterium]|nr:HAD hydrolase family protein [Saprospiraceae bacterium]